MSVEDVERARSYRRTFSTCRDAETRCPLPPSRQPCDRPRTLDRGGTPALTWAQTPLRTPQAPLRVGKGRRRTAGAARWDGPGLPRLWNPRKAAATRPGYDLHPSRATEHKHKKSNTVFKVISNEETTRSSYGGRVELLV